MRPDDQRKYLWDALSAIELLREFSAGKSFDDYQADAMLRSAVERQFEIIGEALNQLSKVDTDLASAIPNLGQIVACVSTVCACAGMGCGVLPAGVAGSLVS
jgi:uncharacterized protein with HEPN domain